MFGENTLRNYRIPQMAWHKKVELYIFTADRRYQFYEVLCTGIQVTWVESCEAWLYWIYDDRLWTVWTGKSICDTADFDYCP